MRKILSITILICLFTFKANSQCQDQNFEYKKYPGICVENAVKWYNMSRTNWTTEMQKFDFSDTGFKEGGAPFFSTSSDHSDIGIQLVISKDFGLLEISNMPIGDFKKDIFKNIIDELEPYFNRKSGDMNIFKFKYTDNNTYEIGITQTRMVDLIFMRKL